MGEITFGWIQLLCAGFLLTTGTYMLYVWSHRHTYLKFLVKKYPDPEVVLQNHDIALEIFGDMFNKEFILATRMALSVSNFKALAINSISETTAASSKNIKNTNYQLKKAAVDICELLEPHARIKNEIAQGRSVDEKQIAQQFERREASVNRINKAHSKYKILNEDSLYILYIFSTEMIRWGNLCERRKLDIREKYAVFKVWHEIGILMGIKDIPDTLQEWESSMHEYGKNNVKYHERNWKAADACLKYLTSDLPKPIRALVYVFFPCILEDYECASFGLPIASPMKQALFYMILRLRRWYTRYFCLPRKSYRLDTTFESDISKNFEHIHQPKSNLLYKEDYIDQKPPIEDFMPDFSLFHSFSIRD
ncbi:hypothetical protein BY458DRAFT_499148, partial [Sporodiniella umbellata]